MPASKQLLRSILIKPFRVMESKGLALNVHAWTVKYCEMSLVFNRILMAQFINCLQLIYGEDLPHVSAYAEKISDVRLILGGSVPALLNAVERELPMLYTVLATLDWRALFEIPVPAPVTIVVTKPSDESSDSAGSGGSSGSINDSTG